MTDEKTCKRCGAVDTVGPCFGEPGFKSFHAEHLRLVSPDAKNCTGWPCGECQACLDGLRTAEASTCGHAGVRDLANPGRCPDCGAVVPVSASASPRPNIDAVLAQTDGMPLVEALSHVATWENERAVAQAQRGVRDPHTGALWDTCFRHAFQALLDRRGCASASPLTREQVLLDAVKQMTPEQRHAFTACAPPTDPGTVGITGVALLKGFSGPGPGDGGGLYPNYEPTPGRGTSNPQPCVNCAALTVVYEGRIERLETELAWLYNITARDNVTPEAKEDVDRLLRAERARLDTFRSRMQAAELEVTRLRGLATGSGSRDRLRELLTSLYNLPGVAEALVGADDDFALAGEIADALGITRTARCAPATDGYGRPCTCAKDEQDETCPTHGRAVPNASAALEHAPGCLQPGHWCANGGCLVKVAPSSCADMHIDVERYESLMVVLAHARAAVDAPDTTRVMHALARLSTAIRKADQFTSPAPKEKP